MILYRIVFVTTIFTMSSTADSGMFNFVTLIMLSTAFKCYKLI